MPATVKPLSLLYRSVWSAAFKPKRYARDPLSISSYCSSAFHRHGVCAALQTARQGGFNFESVSASLYRQRNQAMPACCRIDAWTFHKHAVVFPLRSAPSKSMSRVSSRRNAPTGPCHTMRTSRTAGSPLLRTMRSRIRLFADFSVERPPLGRPGLRPRNLLGIPTMMPMPRRAPLIPPRQRRILGLRQRVPYHQRPVQTELISRPRTRRPHHRRSAKRTHPRSLGPPPYHQPALPHHPIQPNPPV